ncbi:MAG: hypothetical protein ABWJ98_00055 [Hydrogenothermaceae bacterium]
MVIGNPPYRGKFSEYAKDYFKKYYKCTGNENEKGFFDTFALFIEKGFNNLRKDGNLIFIVPISITSSESMVPLHRLLENNCQLIKISSYAVRPQPIFESADVNNSIISFSKTLTPVEKILCSKMYRKSKRFNLQYILNNLKFIDVKNYKLKGRYPKISYEIETQILDKLFSHKTRILHLIKEDGKKIFYRSSGGRYFKVIAPYPTNSSKDVTISLDKRLANTIGCILSSNLFF